MILLDKKISERKLDHIKVCLEEDVEAHLKSTGFEDIDLIHQANPGIDLQNVDITTELFGKSLEAPIIICPMTGGHKRGEEINKVLAETAQELGIATSVGSQRAAIEDPDCEKTYRVRDVAPDVLLLGNLGAVQFAQGYGTEEVEKAIEMIDADALGIHFNPLQEAIQSEGETDFKNALKEISKVTAELKHPVYAKETGGGITGSIATQLEEAGAEAIDVSGAGGTSWAGVEAMRENESERKLGEVFWDWGIPTSVCTAEVSGTVDVPIISSGGIRTGIDAAKSIALGAELVGIGLPLFRASVQGKEKVINWLREFIQELKVAMFLSGSKNIDELQNAELKISNQTREWFISRELNPEKYR